MANSFFQGIVKLYGLSNAPEFRDSRTATGLVTIQVLAVNEPDFFAVRKALIEEQVLPLE
jgi:hypothetical protein